MAAQNRIDGGGFRNPSLNIRPDLAKAASAVTGKASSTDELVGARGAWWWTGKTPSECGGFDVKSGVLRALPMPTTKGFTRAQLLDYFDNCWTMDEVLFASLQGADAFVRQPYHQLRHPMVFYYCHPCVLYVNKFRVAGLLTDGIDPFMEQVFETGVDEMSWDDLSRARDDWPEIRQITEYKKKAYKVIRDCIATHPALDKEEVTWEDMGWAVFMGFEHERIHIETSSVLIRELPLHCVRKPEFWPDYHPSHKLPSPPVPTEGTHFPVNTLVQVAGELVVLGKDMSYPSFGWDNEYGRKDIEVSTFKASKYKVTNGEFLRFVKAGGYSNPKFWCTEGWGWKTFRNVKWPTFWIGDGPQGLHRYKLRVLFDAIEMRWDWPVDANYHEAKAYCAWKTEADNQVVLYRIVTEAEHNLMRNTNDRTDAWRFVPAAQGGPAVLGDPCVGAERPRTHEHTDLPMMCSGQDAEAKVHSNIQLAHGSPNPVTALPPTERGFHDVFGSAWEWAEDHFAAYDGYKVHPFYEDFSSPCFGGKHQLILGGSFASTGQLASKFARYQFRPHFFQHATFRLVQPVVDTSLYDADRYSAPGSIYPFVHTSCMDAAPPHVGDGPCCSSKRRAHFTSTQDEEKRSTRAKLESTQIAYESDALLAQYLSMHYGPTDRVYPSELTSTSSTPASDLLSASLCAPAALGLELSALAQKHGLMAAGAPGGRALDLGCAVGRACFELSRAFGEVVGVDISKTFIEVANKMKENRHVEYECKVEGNITERLSAVLPAPSLESSAAAGVPASSAQAPVAPERCRFVQGDACALPQSFTQGTFDAVLAANLLDRVPEPRTCIAQIHAALRPGGVAIITSPYSWQEQYTDRSNWMGGDYKDGRPHRSCDAVRDALLASGFEVLEEGHCPLLLREHARRFQLVLSHKLVVRRK